VGETILDIIFKEGEPKTARPGGSSFNAAITLGRLGAPVTFISEMGQDRVGDMIEAFLEENGVASDYVSRYEIGQSAIALAFLNQKSDAEYQFYKDYPHQRLAVDFPDFKADDLLMFGSFYALNPGIRPRVKELLIKAEIRGQTLAQMALAWILSRKQVTSVLIGASSVAQLEANVATINNLKFSQNELEAINNPENPDAVSIC